MSTIPSLEQAIASANLVVVAKLLDSGTVPSHKEMRAMLLLAASVRSPDADQARSASAEQIFNLLIADIDLVAANHPFIKRIAVIKPDWIDASDLARMLTPGAAERVPPVPVETIEIECDQGPRARTGPTHRPFKT